MDFTGTSGGSLAGLTVGGICQTKQKNLPGEGRGSTLDREKVGVERVSESIRINCRKIKNAHKPQMKGLKKRRNKNKTKT